MRTHTLLSTAFALASVCYAAPAPANSEVDKISHENQALLAKRQIEIKIKNPFKKHPKKVQDRTEIYETTRNELLVAQAKTKKERVKDEREQARLENEWAFRIAALDAAYQADMKAFGVKDADVQTVTETAFVATSTTTVVGNTPTSTPVVAPVNHPVKIIKVTSPTVPIEVVKVTSTLPVESVETHAGRHPHKNTEAVLTTIIYDTVVTVQNTKVITGALRKTTLAPPRFPVKVVKVTSTVSPQDLKLASATDKLEKTLFVTSVTAAAPVPTGKEMVAIKQAKQLRTAKYETEMAALQAKMTGSKGHKKKIQAQIDGLVAEYDLDMSKLSEIEMTGNGVLIDYSEWTAVGKATRRHWWNMKTKGTTVFHSVHTMVFGDGNVAAGALPTVGFGGHAS